MMGYEEQILTWLVDSQERKDPESGNARKASISIAVKFPEYKEPSAMRIVISKPRSTTY